MGQRGVRSSLKPHASPKLRGGDDARRVSETDDEAEYPSKRPCISCGITTLGSPMPVAPSYQLLSDVQTSPAQKVVEAFMLESLDGTTEHLPSRSHETRLSLSEILMMIDEAIQKGAVMQNDEYVGYWRRWQALMRFFIKQRAKLYVRKHRDYYTDLLKEHRQYYRQRIKGTRPGPFSDIEHAKTAQRKGKRTYHEMARPVRDSNGRRDRAGVAGVSERSHHGHAHGVLRGRG